GRRRISRRDAGVPLHSRGLLELFAAALALLFLLTGRVTPAAAWRATDLDLLLVLFALLVTVEVLRASGYLDLIVRASVSRFRTTRAFGIALIAFSGALASLVTNDVTLFVVIPFTVIASRFSDFDIEDAIILQIVASNLLGCLTPLGNPQNLFVHHQSGWTIAMFVRVMLPFVAWSAAGLLAAVFLLGPSHAMKRNEVEVPARNGVAALAGVACFALVLLEVARVISAWPAAIAAVIAWAIFLRRRVDVSIVPLFFFAFIIVEGLRSFAFELRTSLYFTSIALSQVISNVPATVLLTPFAHGEWRELLYGVNAGGCGTIIASLANLLGWRIYVRESNRDPRFFRRLTMINVAFLLWSGAGGWLLLKAQ
ncbi:MAG TPA: SLC13 family permease, partial [Thermoanaerobaculia bacterium]|nr:SLC13 family permease [Thermoanaerobaculia bacterium]